MRGGVRGAKRLATLGQGLRPVWMVGASGIRRRWRRVVLLVFVVGAVGAVTFAAAAGARRTSSALTRFNAASRSADLQIETGEPTAAQLEAFRRVPEVAAMAVLPEFLIVPDRLPAIVNVPAAVDATFGSVIDRARLITGCEANPAAVDEITIGEGLASLLQLKVGGHLDAASPPRSCSPTIVGHLVATPQHYGWTWDFTTVDNTTNTPCGGNNFGVERLPGVEDVAELCYTQGLHVDGRAVPAMAFASLRGAVTPEIVAGRAPRGPREVALDSTTLRALGKGIGDTVRLSSAKATLDYQVVGRVVLPPIGFGQPLADGAVLTGAGNAPLFDLNSFYRYFVGRYAPGADRGATNRAIAANPELAAATTPTVPAEVDHLRQIGWIPWTLAALLGGLALLAVGHARFTSVRRRRQELALLKTLGFTRGQMRATITWQAATVAAVGLVVGVPTGLVVGDIIWRAVANALGISTITTVPALALLIMIPTALAFVGLVAFFPAQAAARARPAIVLRSE